MVVPLSAHTYSSLNCYSRDCGPRAGSHSPVSQHTSGWPGVSKRCQQHQQRHHHHHQHLMTPAKCTSGNAGPSHGAITQQDWDITQSGQARAEGDAHRPDVQVVLVQPQIPQNTGNVARTCAATNVALHLVGPLGFEIDDTKLKRAGLDYWGAVCVKLHNTWEDFYAYFQGLDNPKRLVGYSVYGETYYAGPEFQYTPGDWLLFGAETTGLPMHAHKDIVDSGGVLVKIPIVDTYVRSINQSVAVGVGVFEAIRQLDEGRHVVQPRDDANNAMVRIPTPMQMMNHQQQQQQQQQQDTRVVQQHVAAVQQPAAQLASAACCMKTVL